MYSPVINPNVAFENRDTRKAICVMKLIKLRNTANKNRFIFVPVQNIACFSHICSCLHLTEHKNQMKLIHKMSNNHETLQNFISTSQNVGLNVNFLMCPPRSINACAVLVSKHHVYKPTAS